MRSKIGADWLLDVTRFNPRTSLDVKVCAVTDIYDQVANSTFVPEVGTQTVPIEEGVAR